MINRNIFIIIILFFIFHNINGFILSSTRTHENKNNLTPSPTQTSPAIITDTSDSDSQSITPEGNNCTNELSIFFMGDKQLVQLLVFMPNGSVGYSRNRMIPFEPFGLTNSDRFSFSFSNQCDQFGNKQDYQPFSVFNMQSSFNNQGAFVIKKDGSVYFSPVWLSKPYQFQLTCQPGGHNYAWTEDNIFISIEFVLGRPIGT